MSTYKSTILVTGGTLGLGYWTTFELASQHPDSKIVVANRSDQENAVEKLNKAVQNQHNLKQSSTPQIEFMSLDLASTTNVRHFVQTFASSTYPPIKSLVLNAGLQYHQGKDIRLSPDGVESTFAINHLGHALLFFLLKPYLASDARIVITSSGTHDPAQKTMIPDAVFESAELLAHPTDHDGYEIKQRGAQRYSSSKLANVLFTYALERRLKGGRDAGHNSLTVVTMDPGLMPGTGLGRDLGPVIYWIANNVLTHLVWLLKLIIRSKNVHLPQESGKNQARLASQQGEKGVSTSGRYFEGDHEIASSVDSHDQAKQEDLWRWTVDFLAKDEKEKREFETF